MFNTSLAEQNRKLFFPNHQTLGRYCLTSDYQLDLFSTEEGGFAICLRYGPPGNTRLLVYDGGSAETGKMIVDHVREHYDSPIVHDLVCSHPMAEQCTGLFPILESLEVKQFWMHRPWLYSSEISQQIYDLHEADLKVLRHSDSAIALTFMLESLALRRDVAISEPFQGAQIGPMRVMSPHVDWYIHRLVPDFMNSSPALRRMMPETIELLTSMGITCGGGDGTPSAYLTDAGSHGESGQCSAEMESSVVLFGLIGGEGILLTGNAGQKALSNTASYAEHLGIHLPAHLRLLQVPHGGNANHLSSSLLDRLIGVEQPLPPVPPRLTAFVSSPHVDKKLPHQVIVDALIRRGIRMLHAQGSFQTMSGAHDD